ncbi:MAG: hypothetical protein ACRDUY_08080 [Nitriliruptorales bacterium]
MGDKVEDRILAEVLSLRGEVGEFIGRWDATIPPLVDRQESHDEQINTLRRRQAAWPASIIVSLGTLAAVLAQVV